MASSARFEVVALSTEKKQDRGDLICAKALAQGPCMPEKTKASGDTTRRFVPALPGKFALKKSWKPGFQENCRFIIATAEIPRYLMWRGKFPIWRAARKPVCSQAVWRRSIWWFMGR